MNAHCGFEVFLHFFNKTKNDGRIEDLQKTSSELFVKSCKMNKKETLTSLNQILQSYLWKMFPQISNFTKKKSNFPKQKVFFLHKNFVLKSFNFLRISQTRVSQTTAGKKKKIGSTTKKFWIISISSFYFDKFYFFRLSTSEKLLHK